MWVESEVLTSNGDLSLPTGGGGAIPFGDLNYLGIHTIRNGEAQYSLEMFHHVVNTGYVSDKASPNPAESRMPRKRGDTSNWLTGS